MANVLMGKYNLSGKLLMTFARNTGQMPMFYYKLELGRPRNLYNSDYTPIYSFGYGLSYTTFEISEPKLVNSSIDVGESTKVQVALKNTGKYYGEEVFQMYNHDVNSKYRRPAKELRNFKKVGVKPGESKIVELDVTSKQLEYWSDGGWVVEPGEFEVMSPVKNIASTCQTCHRDSEENLKAYIYEYQDKALEIRNRVEVEFTKAHILAKVVCMSIK